MRAPRRSLRLVTGDTEHGVGVLVVALEPLQDGLWRVRGHEHLESALGNPSTCEGPQEVGFATMVRAAPGRGSKRGSPAPAAHCEAQPAQDAAGLVGIEVGAIKAGHQADHLLGREPLTGYDDVVFPSGSGRTSRSRRPTSAVSKANCCCAIVACTWLILTG
jgi:hypothetical protein